MYLVLSKYKVHPDLINARLSDHRAWMEVHYKSGVFILSGRRDPPTGGFMLARGIDRDDLEALLASDPFRIDDLLDHEIIGLLPMRASAELTCLTEDAA